MEISCTIGKVSCLLQFTGSLTSSALLAGHLLQMLCKQNYSIYKAPYLQAVSYTLSYQYVIVSPSGLSRYTVFASSHLAVDDRLHTLRLAEEENLPRSQMLESKWIAKSLLNFISRNKDRVAALFELLSIFTSRTRVSFYFLKTFLAERVAEEYTVEEQRKVRLPALELWSRPLNFGHNP